MPFTAPIIAQTPPTDATRLPVQDVVDDFGARHGGMVGAPYNTSPAGTQDPIYRYTFADGSWVEATSNGAIKSSKETPVKTDKPAKPGKSGTGTKPSPPDQWVTITDANGNPIARQDPATGQTVDIPKPTTPRTDTPAQTQNAGSNAQNAGTNSRNADTRSAGQQATASTNQQNADTRTAAQGSTAEHQANQDENARTLAGLRQQALDATNKRDQARIDYQNRQQQLNDDYRNNKLTLEQYNFESLDNHRKAQDSQAQADLAEKALRDEQTAQYNQGLLTNKQTEMAETARSHQATEAQTASNAQDTRDATALTALNERMRTEQQARDAAATNAAVLLKDRATLAQGTNDTLFNAATSSKNIGLGTHADISGLPAASQAFATDSMGGQSIFDEAIQRVHDANPALSGTPEGAAYSSLLAQVMQKRAQVEAGGFTAPGSAPDSSTTPNWQRADQSQTPPTDDGNAAPGMAGTVTPDDPRFLGTVIGAAVKHFAQSDINEGTSRRAPTDSFTAP